MIQYLSYELSRRLYDAGYHLTTDKSYLRSTVEHKLRSTKEELTETEQIPIIQEYVRNNGGPTTWEVIAAPTFCELFPLLPARFYGYSGTPVLYIMKNPDGSAFTQYDSSAGQFVDDGNENETEMFTPVESVAHMLILHPKIFIDNENVHG